MQGWVIQIGATPDKTQAMTLLDNAKEKGGKALRNATPFTVAFSNDGAQLYRAASAASTIRTRPSTHAGH